MWRNMIRLLRPPSAALGRTARLSTASQPPLPPSHGQSEDPRLYRFAHIRFLRALLRVKIFQLGTGLGVLLPTGAVLQGGAMPTLLEGGVVAAVVGGTIATGATLGWYCERLVGEVSWHPTSRILRLSTLTLLGERRDADFSLEQLLMDGFAPAPPAARRPSFPTRRLVPLELCGKTYIFVWDPRHVLQPLPLANLLVHNALPVDTADNSQAAHRASRR